MRVIKDRTSGRITNDPGSMSPYAESFILENAQKVGT